MIFKKDNFILGLILGIFAPFVGILIFKMYKFSVFSFRETFQYLLVEPGFKTLTVALSLSLLLNALLFTIYINSGKDYTAKGIFVTTLLYGLLVLSIKTFS
ncbi:MAG: hypothetical protein H7X88_03225 [Gloeobacteraceae cyanobacterium ES-bin-316]|nr:hypothetical protein [Ferruginibacter sp.]